jgi:hypothetical protein
MLLCCWRMLLVNVSFSTVAGGLCPRCLHRGEVAVLVTLQAVHTYMRRCVYFAVPGKILRVMVNRTACVLLPLSGTSCVVVCAVLAQAVHFACSMYPPFYSTCRP